MAESCRHEEARDEVARAARELLQTRLVVNTSGNVSRRVGDLVAITPSGRAYDGLGPVDICLLDLNGRIVDGSHLPSSETELHLEMYRHLPDCDAIVHTHSVNATAASMLTGTLPAIHYQMVDLGGPVPVAPYATFGSPELARSVIATIPGHTAVLMENHGSISFGPTIGKAMSRAILLEWCAEVWLRAKSAGTPRELGPEEMAAAREQMAEYARRRDACACGGGA